MFLLYRTAPWLASLFAAVSVEAQTPTFIRFQNPSFGACDRKFVVPPGWTPKSVFLAGTNQKDLRIIRFCRDSEMSPIRFELARATNC